MIFYFTGTGNSLYVAQKLANKFNTRLISTKDASNKSNYNFQMEENEILGIIAPVYYMGLPYIVDNFIKNLNLTGIPGATFSIVTFGGVAGNAIKNIEKLLLDKNIKVNYNLNLRMPENNITYYNPPSKEEQQKIIQRADIEISKFITAFLEENPSNYNIKENILKKISSNIFYILYGFSNKTKKFYTTEKCIGCKMCIGICPSNAIIMENKRPKWIKNICDKCLGCINRCPYGAIEYGKNTLKRTRYVNSLVKFYN